MQEFHIEDVSNDEADEHSPDQPEKCDQSKKRAKSPPQTVQIPNFGTTNWIDSFALKQQKKKPGSKLLPGSFFSNYDQTFDDVFGEERIELPPAEEVKIKKKKIVIISKEKSLPKTHSVPKDHSDDSKGPKPARLKLPRQKREPSSKDPLDRKEVSLPKTSGDSKQATKPIEPKKNVKKPKSRPIQKIKETEVEKESELDKIIADKRYDPNILQLPKSDPIKIFKPGKKDLGVRQAYFSLTFDDEDDKEKPHEHKIDNTVDQEQPPSQKKEKKKHRKESRSKHKHNEDHQDTENAIDKQLRQQKKNKSESEKIPSNGNLSNGEVIHKKKKSKRSKKDINEVNQITLNTVSRLEDISQGEQASLNNKRERRQACTEKLIVGQYVAKPKKKVKIDEEETLDMDEIEQNPYIPDCVPNYYTDYDPTIKIIEHSGDAKQSAVYLIVQNGKEIKYSYKEMNLKYPNQIREYLESIESEY